MSFSKVKPAGWSSSETLTSLQITTLDADHANAVDKTGDTVTGGLTFSGASGYINFNGSATQGLIVNAGSRILCSGATFTCSGPATISSGGSLTCASGSSLTVSSGCTTAISLGNGSTLATAGGTTGNIALGDGLSDILIGSATTRTVWIPGRDVILASAAGPVVALGAFGQYNITSGNNSTVFVYQGYAQTQQVNTANANAYLYTFPIRSPINGATLSTATLYFIPNTAHVALPNFPAIGVYRTKYDGTAANVALKSGTSYVQYSTASLVTYNGGTALSVVVTLDQNNVIDSSQYSYDVCVWDEAFTNALSGMKFLGVQIGYTNITDMSKALV